MSALHAYTRARDGVTSGTQASYAGSCEQRPSHGRDACERRILSALRRAPPTQLSREDLPQIAHPVGEGLKW